MSAAEEVIDAPLDRQQIVARWQALCADPGFEDLSAEIQLTEWGEILMRRRSRARMAIAACSSFWP
jgi:hypothetical protein